MSHPLPEKHLRLEGTDAVVLGVRGRTARDEATPASPVPFFGVGETHHPETHTAIPAAAVIGVLGVLGVKSYADLGKHLVTVLEILGICTLATLPILALVSLAKGKGQS